MIERIPVPPTKYSSTAFPELREQATALRLAGKSLREIKEITGVRSSQALADAVRGVPPPDWTRRPRAKDDARAKARELRARGYTYLEIAAELDVSKSSVSLWTRDMPRVGRSSRMDLQSRDLDASAGTRPAESARRQASLELREQATALRLAGKSLREIKEITGVTSNSRLSEAVRGVPPQPWTRRPRAKDDLRDAARALRAKGYTYLEIVAEIGVSKSSVSLWCSDMPRVGRLSREEIRKRNAAGVGAFWAEESPRREARRQAISNRAAAEIGALTDREVIIAGAMAYWCEGAKNKPYRRIGNDVAFINSDPKLILFFMRFLTVAGIERGRIYCRVSIHESADVAGAERFWRQVTAMPADQFRRTTLKRHNPTTNRKNTTDAYHGCLIVRVLGAAELYRKIEGWAGAVMSGS